jgi:hypothetical protein
MPRKRRRKYKTGFYKSKKTDKRMAYRSSYELRMMKCLDLDDCVESYEYEETVIKHVRNRVLTDDQIRAAGDKKFRSYTPDFIITFNDGRKIMIEVKSEVMLHSSSTQRKKVLGEVYCSMHDMKYHIWTLHDIIPYEMKLNIDMPDHEYWLDWKESQHE